MFQVIFVVLAVIAALIHLALSPGRRKSRRAIAGTYLLYLLFIYVGFMGILTAYAHVFVQLDVGLHWMVNEPIRVRSRDGGFDRWSVGNPLLLSAGKLLVGYGHCQRRLATGRLCRACSADSAYQQSCS